MFAGFLQLIVGIMGLAPALTRLVPYSVVQGVSNAMALYILAAQFRFGKVAPDKTSHAQSSTRNLVEPGHSWAHIVDDNNDWEFGSSLAVFGIHAGLAFVISFGLPRVTKFVPSSFVAIIACTFTEHIFFRQTSDFRSALVQDFGMVKTPTLEPVWTDSDISMPGFNIDTFRKVYLYGLALFGTSFCESFTTVHVVDELTEVKGDKNMVAIGQGVANIVSAVFGGMGGSGSIAQSIVANHSDGITNLCTFLTGTIMMFFIYAAAPIVNIVPLGAIGGIMTWAAFKLVDWESLLQALATLLPLTIRDRLNLDCKTPRADSLIMLAVMALTLCLDLSIGLLSGVLIAAFVYVWDSSTRVIVEREVNAEESTSVTYNVTGPLFFATAGGFCDIFPLEEIQFDPDEVVILLEGAEIYDYSGMVALKKVYDRFADLGKVVALSSISPTSRRLMEKTAYMWQGVNFLEVEEVDQSLDQSTLQSVDHA
mmetsp:Transcript_24664/g.36533  ORF Transcript_24664/g.36533 Transcript_24664/m.36533 type:complete len:481 (+) Transcript_24664:1-1443(+)